MSGLGGFFVLVSCIKRVVWWVAGEVGRAEGASGCKIVSKKHGRVLGFGGLGAGLSLYLNFSFALWRGKHSSWPFKGRAVRGTRGVVDVDL